MQTFTLVIPRDEDVEVRVRYEQEPVRTESERSVDGPPPPLPRAVEALLRRHENYDPTTNSRAVVEALRASRWQAFEPTRRKQTAGLGPSYVRMIYTGHVRTVTAVVNTRIIEFPLATIHLAEQHGATSTTERYWRVQHSPHSVEAALNAAAAVACWADGDVA